MKRSYILLGLTILAFTLYCYDRNSQCYEIISVDKEARIIDELGTMLLDKCRGRTYLIVQEDLYDEDGKVKGTAPTWVPMNWSEGIVYRKKKK